MTATMGSETQLDPVREFLRIARLGLLAAAGLAVIGYFPAVSYSGAPGVRAMAFGIGIAVVGGWLGMVPPLWFLRRPLREFPSGILAGLLVRFLATLGIALAAWALSAAPHVPLLIWVAVGQSVVLTIDTIGMIKLARRLGGER